MPDFSHWWLSGLSFTEIDLGSIVGSRGVNLEGVIADKV